MSRQEHLHPSYGLIQASRVQGGASLFDSAIRHHNYVVVSISGAVVLEGDGRSSIMEGKELISVAMSEGQFATFITSMNVGSGASCTIQRLQGKQVTAPPEENTFRQTYETEIRDAAEAVSGEIDKAMTALVGLIKKGKAGKTELREVMEGLEAAARELKLNLPYVMREMTEKIERLVVDAKHDITGHAMMLSQSLGQPGALGNADDRLPQLGDNDKKPATSS